MLAGSKTVINSRVGAPITHASVLFRLTDGQVIWLTCDRLQGDEGAPDAWLNVDPHYREGLRDVQTGDEILVLTWLDRARRDLLAVYPRDNTASPMRGVFSTRSADRPNPIGLHRVQVLAIHETRIRVRNLEAVDGTPVLDLKPVLGAAAER